MEYRYDVYGLCESREVEPIETFLRHFANWDLAEKSMNRVITIIPDIPRSEKEKLFKPVYAYANGSPRRARLHPTIGFNGLTEPETVQVDTLSHAIELGVSRKNVGFSLYLPSSTHANVHCLVVHFTLDQQVLLGLAVSDGKNYDFTIPFRVAMGLEENPEVKNKLLAEKIRDELLEVLPLKATAITFGRFPPDNEQDFLGFKGNFENMSNFAKGSLRKVFNDPIHYKDEQYYIQYRSQMHRQCGQLHQEDGPVLNLFDNFSVGSKREALSVIKTDGDTMSLQRVSNPGWIDVVKIPYLNYLLDKAVSATQNKSQLSAIHRVSIPFQAKTNSLWIGHRDGVSNFTIFEGIKAAEVVIEDTYCLDKEEDLNKLAEEGFFDSYQSIFNTIRAKGYAAWLTKFGHT